MSGAPSPDLSRSRAVLVGTWDYNHLSPVPAVEHSFARMVELLTSPACGWPAERITTLPNVERPADLPRQLIALFDDAEDVALFYYVGHGQPDYRGRLCLGLVETESEARFRAVTSLKFEDVRNALQCSRARTKIVLLDCCFAGLAIQPEAALSSSLDVADRAACEGAYTMAASGEFDTARYEESADTTVLPLTYFTKYLADVAFEGIAGEGPRLSLEAIFRQLVARMQARGLPEPTQANRGTVATFPFCRNAATDALTHDPEEKIRRGADSPPPTVGRWTVALLAVLAMFAAIMVLVVQAKNESSGDSASPPTVDRKETESDAQQAGSPPPDTQPPANEGNVVPDVRDPPTDSVLAPPGTVTVRSSPYEATSLLMCRHSSNDFVFRMLSACTAPYSDPKWAVGSGYLGGQEEPNTIPLYEHYCTGGNPSKGNKCLGFTENRYYSRGSAVDQGNGWNVHDAQVRVVSDCPRNTDHTDANPTDGLQPIYQVLYFEDNQTVRKYTIRTGTDLTFPGLGAPSYVEFLGCTWQ